MKKAALCISLGSLFSSAGAAAFAGDPERPYRIVAKVGDAVPREPGRTYLDFAGVSLNNFGRVAFVTSASGTGIGSASDEALMSEADGMLRAIAFENQGGPGSGELVIARRAISEVSNIPQGFPSLERVEINDNGYTSFRAVLSPPGQVIGDQESLWVSGPDGLRVAVAEGLTVIDPERPLLEFLESGVLGPNGEFIVFVRLANFETLQSDDEYWVYDGATLRPFLIDGGLPELPGYTLTPDNLSLRAVGFNDDKFAVSMFVRAEGPGFGESDDRRWILYADRAGRLTQTVTASDVPDIDALVGLRSFAGRIGESESFFLARSINAGLDVINRDIFNLTRVDGGIASTLFVRDDVLTGPVGPIRSCCLRFGAALPDGRVVLRDRGGRTQAPNSLIALDPIAGTYEFWPDTGGGDPVSITPNRAWVISSNAAGRVAFSDEDLQSGVYISDANSFPRALFIPGAAIDLGEAAPDVYTIDRVLSVSEINRAGQIAVAIDASRLTPDGLERTSAVVVSHAAMAIAAFDADPDGSGVTDFFDTLEFLKRFDLDDPRTNLAEPADRFTADDVRTFLELAP